MVLYTFSNRGPSDSRGPYCPLLLQVLGLNSRFVIFTPSTMGAVFFDPRVEVPAGFPYVGFTAFTRDAVKAGFTAGGESVFVDVKERLELVRG